MTTNSRTLLTDLIFLLALISFNSCDPTDYRLRIANNSKNTICVEIGTDSILSIPSINFKEYYLAQKVMPGDTRVRPNNGGFRVWEEIIKKSKSKKLFVFIFDYDSVQQNNWDTLRKYRRFKKMYHFSTKELEREDWLINYK